MTKQRHYFSIRIGYWAILLSLTLLVITFTGCRKEEKEPAKPVVTEGDSMESFDEKSEEKYSYAPSPTVASINRKKEAVPVITASPKPTKPLAKEAKCMTTKCHASMIYAKQIHGPVSIGNCDSCHGDDTGKHTFPMKRKGNNTCLFCHPVLNEKEHQHAAVKEGCVTCHNPHISKTKFLLTADSIGNTCAKCHEMPDKKYVHGPFAQRQCTACHEPHESKNAFLIRGKTGVEHCYTCHEEIRVLIANSPIKHRPATESCTNCHDPHTTNNPAQLKKSIRETCFSCHKEMGKFVKGARVSHDALLVKDSCVNCHNPHASGRPKLLRDRADRLCLECHSKPVKDHDGKLLISIAKQLKSKYLHGPVRSGNCTACHNVHGSSNRRLLKETFSKSFYADFNIKNYALCFTCHNTDLVVKEKTTELTDFRNGDVNLHFIHVNRKKKGRSCRTCHVIHGSDLPKHIAKSVPFAGSKWAMPIGFEKNKNGGSCAPGCHDPRSYQRTIALPKNNTN